MSDYLQEKIDYIFIIPVYNEARILERSARLLLDFLEKKWAHRNSVWKLIIADNASNDKTEEIAGRLMKEFPKHLSYCKISEKGRGAALKEVVKKYRASYYFYSDADIPACPENIPSFLNPLEEKKADIMVGKRSGRRSFRRLLATRLMKFLSDILLNLNISDPQCGFKAFNAKTALLLERKCVEKGYFLDTELLVIAKEESTFQIKEVEIDWIENRFAGRKSKVSLLRESILALFFLFRMANRLDKTFAKTAIASMLLGAVFITVYLWHYFAFGKYGFVTAHQTSAGLGKVQMFAVLFSVLYIFVWIILVKYSKNSRFSLLLSLLIFAAIIFISIFINPTRSQDAYWNLLLTKGFVKYGANPYRTTPADLFFDSWSPYVKSWRFLPMTHGPVSTALFLLPSALSENLRSALFILKIEVLVFLFASIFFLWKILNRLKIDLRKKADILILFILNPFVIQNTLIDAHNDVFIMTLVLLSYYLLLRNKYIGSTLSLVLGILIKYSLIIFIPIPIIKLFQDKNKKLSFKIYALILCFIISLVAAFVAWSPYGLNLKEFKGLENEMLMRGTDETSSIFTVMLKKFLWLDNGSLRAIGAVIALAISSFLAYRKKYLLAYTVPLLFILLFATPWLNSWYFLWFYPLLIIFLSYPVTVFLTILLILNWDVYLPLNLSIFVLFFLLLLLKVRVFRLVSQAKGQLFSAK